MKQKALSEFEGEIMNIIWEKKACTIKDVYTEISEEKQLAYNTIGTIFERLLEKGLVKKKVKKGINIYSPKVSKEIYSENIITSYFTKYITTFGDIGLASFVKSVDTLPKEKREYFLSLLEKYEKK